MSNQDKIFNFFNTKFPFNTSGLEFFVNSFEVRRYQKGDHILKSGQIENELRFLDLGTVRDFYGYKDKEMNTYFYVESGFITDFNSFVKGSQSRKFQECLSDVQLRVLPRETFENFLSKYECGQDFVEQIFQQIIDFKELEDFRHFSLSPDELYIDLVERKPSWLQGIPQYHIASYLRMTPETLSRIRKRN